MAKEILYRVVLERPEGWTDSPMWAVLTCDEQSGEVQSARFIVPASAQDSTLVTMRDDLFNAEVSRLMDVDDRPFNGFIG